MKFDLPEKGNSFSLVLYVKAHALQVVDPPERGRVERVGDKLMVTFDRVTGGEHGDEGLELQYPIHCSPPGADHIIHRDGLDAFVQPADNEAVVMPARDPNPPFLERIGSLKVPTEDVAPIARSAQAPEDWADWIEDLLNARIAELPQEIRGWSGRDASLCDEGLLDDVEHTTERYWYFSTTHDHRFIAYFGEHDVDITLYEVHLDDYMPADDDTLYEMVSDDLKAWINRAVRVEYQYSRDHGWQYRRSPDEDWEHV